ncbi:DUF1523 family protein [Pseudooceanicola sp. LIPI14-2-Ac024]|uniref:DUF1523 family protein n=1 Tax=Pseudooceanicola sp. LIPI14-2-Ac024 TaxID=3344875 RepID=UPI0035CEC427
MRYVKWTFWGLFWLLVLGFLHYTLPQHDIARVTDTYERRIDFGDNSIFWASPDVGSDGTLSNRDVFFIQTVRPNGKVMVYRNEDTGWGWPPYFKFDTANLQAEASDLKSTAENPKWVKITHYGWRNEFFSSFPNAVGVKQVSGPDASTVPWVSIVILVILAAITWAIWVRWRRFRQRSIDPKLEEMGDAIDDQRVKVSRWWNKDKG